VNFVRSSGLLYRALCPLQRHLPYQVVLVMLNAGEQYFKVKKETTAQK